MRPETLKILQKIETLSSLIDENVDLFFEGMELIKKKRDLSYRLKDEVNQILSDPGFKKGKEWECL